MGMASSPSGSGGIAATGEAFVIGGVPEKALRGSNPIAYSCAAGRLPQSATSIAAEVLRAGAHGTLRDTG